MSAAEASAEAPAARPAGCPEWCVTRHDQEVMPGILATFHSTPDLKINLSDYHRGTVSGYLASMGGTPMIYVGGHIKSALYLSPGQIEGFAGIVELLANATPEQHHQLIAAISQAAAMIEAPE